MEESTQLPKTDEDVGKTEKLRSNGKYKLGCGYHVTPNHDLGNNVYWKREPTTDGVAKKYLTPKQLKRCRDTVFYKDREATQFYARLPWDYKGHPTKRTKTRILNCCKFGLKKIEEVKP